MAKEDEAPETEETEDDNLPKEGDDQEGTEEAPETVLAERDRLKTTFAKVKEERTRLRKELAELRKGKEEEPPREDDRLARVAGISALTASGLTRAQAKVAVRLLDLSGVEVDEDGDADLEDAVEELKETFPGLFAKEALPSRRDRLPSRTQRGDRGGSSLPKTDRTTDALLRSAGYR